MTKKGFYAYIRTSTVKQGTEGVSLDVQRSEADRLARQKGVQITKYFCEMETAATQGRPKFTQMIRELRAGSAEGLILHKIDRGARNLREWSDITDLIELNIKVYFVHDALDLTTRGGRLTGDMLAAVAADYVRNLREETKKGILGRLKQGLWPFGAPLGYINNGKGQAKTIDPVIGSLVHEAFELYATGAYTLKSLRQTLYERGLRTKRNRPISKNALTAIFNNRFYVGVLILRSTGEAFPGIHPPLISVPLFEQVQDVLTGRFRRKCGKHHFFYRGRILCRKCSLRLVGERQKGHVYYRCHSEQCKGTSFREEHADGAVDAALHLLRKFIETYPELEETLAKAIELRRADKTAMLRGLSLKRDKIEERLSAVTDAVIDGLIERDIFIRKKNELLDERGRVETLIIQNERGEIPLPPLAEHYLELLKVFRHQAFLMSPHQAREICKFASSNLWASGKSVELQWLDGFEHVLEHAKSLGCALPRDKSRTIARFTKLLMGEEDVPTSPCPRKTVRRPKHAGRSNQF